MLFFILLFLAMLVWPRFILYFFVAPFIGSLLGAAAWVVAMFASGLTLPFSSMGVFIFGGASIALIYSVIWANNNKL